MNTRVLVYTALMTAIIAVLGVIPAIPLPLIPLPIVFQNV
ncbi:biotin transporter BioY, partial [Staphylococcus felis]|nr:biotin transporter BioY [Staphylococcus felis]